MEVLRVLRVIIIRAVILIGGVEGCDTERAAEDGICEFERRERIRWCEEVGGDGHGDEEVGAELVVGVFGEGAVEVFVDTATVDGVFVDDVVFVVGGVEGNVEDALKVFEEEDRPGFVGDLGAVGFGDFAGGEFALCVELRDPFEGAVEEADDLDRCTISRSS